jgi:hypothetical protein
MEELAQTSVSTPDIVQSEESGELSPAVETEPKAAPTHDFRSTKHKVKIDDQESEVSYDDLIKGYQLEKVSRRKMQEAAKLRDDAYEYIQGSRKEGLQYLKNHIPEEQLIQQAVEFLEERVKYENMPEEQRELMKLKREIEHYKAKEEEQQKSVAKTKLEQEEIQAMDYLDRMLSDQVVKLRTKYGNIVGTGIANEIARQLEAYELARSDGEDSDEPDIEAISDKAWQRWDKTVNDYLASMTVEDIVKRLPKEILKGLRKQDLDTALSQLPTGRKIPTQANASKTQKIDDEPFENKWERMFGK